MDEDVLESDDVQNAPARSAASRGTGMSRDYYSRRFSSDGERHRITLREAANRLATAYSFVERKDYLKRSFGYSCVDNGDVPGLHGSSLEELFYLDTGTRITNGVTAFFGDADEGAMFTLVEFVYDHIAKPGKDAGRYHGFNDCGRHYDFETDPFDELAARAEWREKVNVVLKFYEEGYELATSGEIVRLAPNGLSVVLRTQVPAGVSNADRAKVATAIHNFQLGRSTREERKQAVRVLADVLEIHRPAVKQHLTKDEGDLFNIANNFAIRHHRTDERDDYDDDWLAWMFYWYLSTVHLVLGRVHGSAPPAIETPSAKERPPVDAGFGDDDEIPF
jgi:hypothetical protein